MQRKKLNVKKKSQENKRKKTKNDGENTRFDKIFSLKKFIDLKVGVRYLCFNTKFPIKAISS